MKKVRITLWISIAALLIIAAGIYFGMRPKLPKPIVLQTEGQPTIGYPKAKAHIVAFLDPNCSNSKNYHNQLYPIIKEKYIDTNKALYTVITVSLMPESMPVAIALLCTYNQSLPQKNADLFMRFLSYIYEKQPSEDTNWTSSSKLIDLAQKASPDIEPLQLKNCLQAKSYQDQIIENTKYEKKILGKAQAPVLFINGIQIKQLSEKNVNNIMKIILHKHGEKP